MAFVAFPAVAVGRVMLVMGLRFGLREPRQGRRWVVAACVASVFTLRRLGVEEWFLAASSSP